MTDFLDLPTLIVIGIAVVVLLRLRAVLGTRTGNERPPAKRVRANPEAPADNEDNVVPMRPLPAETAKPEDERRTRKLEAEIEQFAHGEAAVAAGLKAIGEADPAFTPKLFLEGAKAAYEMIVTGFAAGDRKTLKNLLEKEIYDSFEAAIAAREAEGHKVEFTFVGLPKVEITEAELDRRIASVTILFNAEIVSATRDASGNLIEGNADQVVTIADEWTFARNTRSRDPNWKLVATSQID